MTATLPTSCVPARPSFEAVYAVGLPFLHQALRWLGVAASDLDDMLQDVFLAAYRGLANYDPWRYHGVHPDALSAGGALTLRIAPDAALRRWLFGIAWRQVSHYHERAHRRREIPSGVGPGAPFGRVDPAPTPEQAIAGADRARLVTALLLKVPPARRVILILHDVLEVSATDIARELQMKENTVWSRLRLAREDFRAAAARLPRERRSALRPASASERPGSAAPAALLRAAREIPAAPAALRDGLWTRLQACLSRPAPHAIAPEPWA
jgi:RNA polymerase sigma-70 factor, ECF subfamily